MTDTQHLAILEQLRTATREAHEALADLKAERKALRADITEARELLPLLTDELFAAEVTRQVDALGKVTEKAMADTVARVSNKIDHYLQVALGTDRRSRASGQPSIPDMLNNPSIPVFRAPTTTDEQP